MLRTLLCAWMVLCATSADAEVWQCIDKETGAKRYTNIERDAKGCKRMNLHLKTPASENAKPSAASSAKPKPVSQADGSFPTVNRDTQRSRDEARRRILEQELAEEERLLAESQNAAQAQNAGSDKNAQRVVELHQENIDNLRKEIASIK